MNSWRNKVARRISFCVLLMACIILSIDFSQSCYAFDRTVYKRQRRDTSHHKARFHLSSSKENVEVQLIEREEITKFAQSSGLQLKSTVTAGIYLQIDAYPVGDDLQRVGYLTAFIRPGGLLHLDTIQVKNRRQLLGYKRQNWTVDGPGISFLMGTWAIKWGYEKGCRRTELLAVRDSMEMNKILVRLYKSFGFKVLREVGDDTKSLPDRLVWGAVGTLMQMNLDDFFREWTPKFRVMQAISSRKGSIGGSGRNESESTHNEVEDS